MKNNGSLRAGLLALLLAAPAAALIQPQVISFQGKLIDPTTNNPKTGLVGLTFNLYRSLTGGTALWTETQNNVPLTNGVFSVELGTYTALPPDLFLGASAYLGVTVVGDAGGEMAPRSRLAMSPFAFTANNLSDAGSVNLIADAVYSTFTNAGNFSVPAGVIGSSGTFANGVTASSFTALNGTLPGFVTVSSVNASAFFGDGSHLTGLAAASGSNTFPSSFTVLGPVLSTASVLATYGVQAATGVFTSSLSVAGSAFSVGTASFTVVGGSATVAYGLTASSASFTGGGGATYALTVSSGVEIQGGTLDVNGGGGITNTYGLVTGTATVTGPTFSVGGSSFSVTGGSATVAYGLTASSASFTGGGGATYALTVSSGLVVQQGTLDVNGGGGITNTYGLVTGSATVVNVLTAGNVSAGPALHVASMTAGGFFKAAYWTLAQIQAYTPAAADLGGIVTCTNCAVPYNICTASGTTLNGFRLSTGTATCK